MIHAKPSTHCVLVGMFGLSACYGGLTGDNAGWTGGQADGSGSADAGTDPGASDGGTPGEDVGDATAGEGGGEDGGEDGNEGGGPELPAPTVRFFRLTHAQWENTVRDLFYLDDITGYSSSFLNDPAQAGFLFDNNALTLEVDQAQWTGYRVAAGQVAALVTSDQATLDSILPPDTGDASARAREFVTSFLQRAFRRAPTGAEIDAYVGIFEDAPAMYTASDPFVAGVRHVIDGVLQSPHFIYRIEQSVAVVGDVVPLDGWEVAQRMSYFLWNTMPDDPLFEAAQLGSLTDAGQVEMHAHRLLADVRATDVVAHFHDQVFEAEKFAGVAPAPAFYPDTSPELGQYALEEYQRFIDHVVLGSDGSYADLLTSNDTFVNAELANIYGLTGTFGDSFVPVTLDPAQRSGLLTQVGFLAVNAADTSNQPDPIHRGVFIAKRLACLSIAAPPDGVPPLPPVDGKSNRQTVEDHTQQPGSPCQGCHQTIINPFGFPFEHYDAIGAYRADDNGFAIDASTTVLLDGTPVPVANALELAQALAASPSVHECYAKHWLEYANGRPIAPEEQPLVARLGQGSLVDDVSVKNMLVALVSSKPFLNRATQELP